MEGKEMKVVIIGGSPQDEGSGTAETIESQGGDYHR